MYKSKYLLLFLLLVSLTSYAQYTVTARVINANDKKPIAQAVAFLNKTGVSATATDSGSFSLKNVPEGHYELIVTIIGYETFKMPLTVRTDMRLPDIKLAPKTNTLNEVTVNGKYKLPPYYYTFRAAFLGNTLFARQCHILNPGVIKFYDTDMQGNYSVKATDFIEIENDALGYKIKVLLNSFTNKYKPDSTSYDGDSYFEEMKGTPGQEHTWQKNRMQCYQGSTMQFLRSVLAGTTRQAGYRIRMANLKKNAYYDPNETFEDPLDDPYLYKIKDSVLHETDIISKTNRPGVFALVPNSSKPNSCLYIEYLGAKNGNAHIPWIWTGTGCYIAFEKPYMAFDYRGIINTPGNVKFYGFLGEARMANQLPQDFEPTE